MSVSGRTDNAKRKFLIVDDHAGFRSLVRDLLIRRGNAVIECVDGADALNAFESEHPDAVIMDIEMPGMDGISATRAIRSVDSEASIAILTQYDSQEMREESQRAGACAYVLKDDLPQLVALINNLPPEQRSKI